MYYTDGFVNNNLDGLYHEAANEILAYGETVTARGLTFKELRFQHLILTDPRNRIITNKERKASKRFMAAEFILMMGSNPWIADIAFYNKHMLKFSDDGISLHGAYGPRLRHWGQPQVDFDQIQDCLRRLKEDIFTRQAVIVILDPGIDFTVKTKDIPCNNLLQFMYREGRLDLACYVRSNDLFLGFPYDVFHWTMLQEIFATALKVKLGHYHHIVGSFHIYDNNIEQMEKIVAEKLIVPDPMKPMPEITSLKILDALKYVEEKYRETGYFINKTEEPLPEWWAEFAEWLKK